MATLESRVQEALRAQKKTPLSLTELSKKAGVRKNENEAYLEIIQDLKAQNKVMDRNGKVILTEHLGLVSGQIIKVTGTFGFGRPAESDKDVFIPGRMLGGAMPGDTVLLRVTKGTGELPEGEVFQVTEAVEQKFSAVLEILEDGTAQVVADRYVRFPMRLGSSRLMGAKHGDKVLAQISSRGKRHSEHRVRILSVFGSSDSAAACCQAILAANDVVAEFSAEAVEQASAIAWGEGIHSKELESRVDLRAGEIFTIDSATSKDLDDAISLRRKDDYWELGVHIADVSYYVTHQTPLDKEAFARGTSVYYANSVIPMLPPELSNGICSLNPGEDRLAFSAMMRLDKDGNLLSYQFHKTVIRSRIKGVYSEINAIFDGTASEEILTKYDGLLETLANMKELSQVMTQSRYARGSVHLESTESQIELNDEGRAIGVHARERGFSEMMIEEFMLVANQAAATLALEKNLPFVYRVHENPTAEKVTMLFDVLDKLGIKSRRPKGDIQGAQMGEILDQVRGTPVYRVVNTMVLRSMAKAKYSEHNVGHFGLALENYAHFTSPIRRYPDLTIHRVLSSYVASMRKESIHRRFDKFVTESASHSFAREVAAMTAERSCEDCYKAEFMRSQLGEEIDGIVTSVAPFGIYVQLPTTVEGLVHVSNFPTGQWSADGNLAFIEAHTGRAIRLGDPVRVKVAGADVSAGTIDFVLVEKQ